MTDRPLSPLSDSENPAPQSRRARFLGLARATRDNYIPKITGSVSQMASGATRAFANPNDLYDDQGRILFPKDTSIHLFPSYTRQVDDKYYIDVKGWVSCPGLMTRKNRLVLSLVRQVTRYNVNNSATDQAINQLASEKLKPDVLHDSDTSDVESTSSDLSKNELPLDPLHSKSSTASSLSNEDLIKERLAWFIARSIPNAPLTIVVGSEEVHGEIAEKGIYTDENGNFETTVEVNYTPSVVQVRATTDDTIFSFQNIMLVPSDGIGLISDIDDTVKLTGVIGDKREMMTSLLLKDVSSWNIPPVIKWYDALYKASHVDFHYVSNSPWQLFSTIDQYFKAVNLPIGSIHLKQYTGNIISSLMEPTLSRKKRSLDKIVKDFPNKRFICVGDSGEYDLEAYVELAKANPGRIISINIRFVENSLSDVDDLKILTELKRILATKRRVVNSPSPKVEEMPNLIDLSEDSSSTTPEAAERRAKLPPMVPKKPSNLKGSQLQKKPPLPTRDNIHRAHTDSELKSDIAFMPSDGNLEVAPPLPRRAPTFQVSDEYEDSHHVNLFDNLQNIYNSPHFYELEEMDKRGATWIRKVITAVQDLEETGTDLRIFTDDEHEFFSNFAIDIKN
ncbi:uncharacterized protein RJT20DRAFT_145874 [Scheffersomyces xylosifermentans]|uniref:uncharacterized protein n=1 Tax=Scheffersomyces xylosifermentans TaxID=1304137 RepID=UPI00315CDF7E